MSTHENTQNINPQKAWVIFSGKADLPWLKCLKPGFRHCFVILNDGRNWVTIDPLLNYMDVMVHTVPAEFDLPRWLQARGHKVVEAPLYRLKKPAPWMAFTCVEAVKRVLGIHARMVLTPWQLYRHLTKKQTATLPPRQILNKGDLAWEV